jgi:hypothetical protein
MTRTLIIIVISIIANSIYSQHRELEFLPTFNGELLVLEKEYKTAKSTVNIEALRFYISKISISDKKQTLTEENSYHLLDLEKPESLNIKIQNINAKRFKLNFCLGIDSMTNVSGAMGGDLDPTKGMYWTWQSGYINFKLEGTYSRCKSRQNRFQYHLGGYAAEFSALQEIELSIKEKEKIIIEIAIDKFLEAANPEQLSEIMSPGTKAVELSKTLKKVISLKK